MHTFRSSALLFCGAALLATAAQAQPPVKAKGDMLVNDAGMTLYTFDKDANGKSACKDDCAKNWPPVTAGHGAKAEGDYTVVDRDDGTKQWAYKGKPLYSFVKDTNAGDRKGDNVRDIWHVAKP